MYASWRVENASEAGIIAIGTRRGPITRVRLTFSLLLHKRVASGTGYYARYI